MNRQLFKQGDFLSGAALVLVGLFMLIDAINFGQFINGSVGADFFPKIVSSCMVATGAGLIFSAVKQARKAAESKPSTATRSDYLSLLITCVLLALYVAMLNVLGFVITTVLYLFLQITALTKREKRNYLFIALISVAVAAVAYLLFVNVFYVMLPRGILG